MNRKERAVLRRWMDDEDLDKIVAAGGLESKEGRRILLSMMLLGFIQTELNQPGYSPKEIVEAVSDAYTVALVTFAQTIVDAAMTPHSVTALVNDAIKGVSTYAAEIAPAFAKKGARLDS